jgi:hypothetical protein
MHIIPVSVVDNFLNNPDSIRNWALTQEFFPDPRGQWPGLRTNPLYDINPELAESINFKYFNLFFNLYADDCKWVVDSRFQLTTGNAGQGWVHQDSDSRLTGIVYLNPFPSPESGTSIYQRKEGAHPPRAGELNHTKVQQYLGNITKEEGDADRVLLNNHYTETIRVSNVYNRLITFDAHLPHAAHDYFGDESSDARLTLVIFVQKLYADRTPISRSKLIL